MAGMATLRRYLGSHSSLASPFFSFHRGLCLMCTSRLDLHASLPPFLHMCNSTIVVPSLIQGPKSTISVSSSLLFNGPFGRSFSSVESKINVSNRRSRRSRSNNFTPSSTKTNFSLSSNSESDSDDSYLDTKQKQQAKAIDKSKLPPPYDPFSKKPVVEEPKDPKNLQEIFHNMKSEGLISNAVKMFDALSKDGLTHEALELFAEIKDKGNMPDVVAHTAVIEAYANAGQPKEALKVYMRMLASGVMPNAYTYTVLIKSLATGRKLADVKKYVMEMMGKGIHPNAATYVAVFEAFSREQKLGEGKEFLQQMKANGFVPDERAVRDVLKGKRGQEFRSVINILFEK